MDQEEGCEVADQFTQMDIHVPTTSLREYIESEDWVAAGILAG